MKRCRNRRFRAALLAAGFAGAMLLRGTPIGHAEPAAGVRVAELSPQTERAIEKALQFLARSQNRDGSWGGSYKGATTSLMLMSFMLKGHFPKRGRYGQVVDRAVVFLLRRVKAGGGYVGGNMYEQGLTVLALSEVWGMSDRKELRDTLKGAVDVILRSQSRSGGWRYHPRPESADMSVTVMQIVALVSAKEAGIYVPQKTIDRAVKYVKRMQARFTGAFGYTAPSNGSFATTAAGVTSLLMCGESSTSRQVRAGLAYLVRYPRSKFTNMRFFYYGHYYAIQAMYQAGESYYQQWYPQIQSVLLAKQQSNGSWGGTNYTTGMAILILGVPYRYLPIYQR